ncbi:carboxypeptidase-like regulatory domain-containing protein [Schlesneria paludicola]|uniref:carboxypeptidase-like regulatory domain-containing protein n=1 Tax=Schlesneria paludicola TaxID=360056 RepID=UPI00029ACED9|nr:carboxypeptidase-like regulatory domain-containing protein [Schlesneria paludicola]
MRRTFNFLTTAAVALATIGIVVPQVSLLGGETTVAPRVRVVAPNSILDVKLSADGTISGRVINPNGERVVGAAVTAKQGAVEAGQSVTDEQGRFVLRNLKTGIYEVGTGNTVGHYRVWTEKSAPPSAMPHCLLVVGENGARGQYGLSQTIVGENLGLILLASTTGLALASLIVALHADRVARAADENSKKSP